MRKDKRRGKGKISRRDVVAVGRELFAKKGFHKTSIDDIVAHIGLGKGTFYAFFDGKRIFSLQSLTRWWASSLSTRMSSSGTRTTP